MSKDEFGPRVLSSGDPVLEPISEAGGTLDDDLQLRMLGKRPLLTRSFGLMSILGLSCSALLSWEAIFFTSISGLLNGGPAGVVWGFLINWVGTASVYTVLAELSSMAPTASGQCRFLGSVLELVPRLFSTPIKRLANHHIATVCVQIIGLR